MPFVHISLPHNTFPQDVTAVADALHNALVATFNVPEPDRFQTIHRYCQGELICTPEFLGVQHSAHVVFVQISCSPGRSLDAKRALYAKIAADIARSSSFKPEDVIINLLETHRENWSFGLGVAQYAL
ncbi:MAG: tautomerase family protein [Polaromonas sp.]